MKKKRKNTSSASRDLQLIFKAVKRILCFASRGFLGIIITGWESVRWCSCVPLPFSQKAKDGEEETANHESQKATRDLVD